MQQEQHTEEFDLSNEIHTTLEAERQEQNQQNWIALYQAIYTDVISATALLSTTEIDLNFLDFNGMSALHHAVYVRSIPLVTLLLHKGARVNLPDNNGGRPLQIAAWKGDTVIAKLLLEKGAKINQPDSNGETPLYVAAWKGDIVMVKLLLAYGAQVDLPNKSGNTALHAAAINHCIDIVELLLKKGADINFQASNEMTALHLVASRNSTAVVNLLLARGARVDLSDKNGWTPLHIADFMHKLNIMRSTIIIKRLLVYGYIEQGVSLPQVYTNDPDIVYYQSARDHQAIQLYELDQYPLETLEKKELCQVLHRIKYEYFLQQTAYYRKLSIIKQEEKHKQECTLLDSTLMQLCYLVSTHPNHNPITKQIEDIKDKELIPDLICSLRKRLPQELLDHILSFAFEVHFEWSLKASLCSMKVTSHLSEEQHNKLARRVISNYSKHPWGPSLPM
jgi:ankyrin repeat protein